MVAEWVFKSISFCFPFQKLLYFKRLLANTDKWRMKLQSYNYLGRYTWGQGPPYTLLLPLQTPYSSLLRTGHSSVLRSQHSSEAHPGHPSCCLIQATSDIPPQPALYHTTQLNSNHGSISSCSTHVLLRFPRWQQSLTSLRLRKLSPPVRITYPTLPPPTHTILAFPFLLSFLPV